ncbi:precorrin-3B C(17)-methyltransferase [Jannaschia rubra]|uniref:Cobalt-precorrin-3B C(17)-methyltransferase n=1 Tax=Jannaschia rubra TaxID=282197 RepID=A0A0M6XMX5_9RHOB|nr:precorrin-3B C(17)-methyltransferase [Jannaschia rubra]CTQ31561.1 Cobalt-precorrin-3B C(17)-methyltransferase [Jannaschia rubra]SFF77222.1 cobalt-precorrin 5A hydrolase / precorrin-3B C17-methyltransferase [Jannaschia rubra]
MALNPVVLCLNAAGEDVARRIAVALDCPLHGRAGRTAASVTFPDALVHVRDLFAAGHSVIGVCAAGILIRAVAPLLADKTAEPPVIAVSDDGRVVVPLLGGHRGANRLARTIADALGGTAAVTTAGDVALGVALDEPPEGWVLANPGAAKGAMAALLSGGGARLTGEAAAEAQWLHDLPQGAAVTIACTLRPPRADETVPDLLFHPQRAALGVGASRDCPPEELIALVDGLLADADVAPAAIAGIFTADIKADEGAVLALSAHLGVPVRYFNAEELEAATPRTRTPSDVVFAEIGSHGVAENAALLGAGDEAHLTHPKRKSAMATAALALSPHPVATLPGRARGRVSIVSIGPGQSAWRTPEASRLIAEAEELVGYSLYIDLLGPLAAGKPRADFPLGGEEARCRHALEQAGEGRNVALVCSGDAGIYAMGALVFELMDRDPAATDALTPAARRVEIVCTPGVSALQAAAARAGAPLGHDFCAISLSDLLTPREDIVARLHAAARGDFVIAFYNPVSKRRRTLLALARDILLEHRPADTPVLLASSLGRPEESLRHRRLADLRVEEVDMLTVVLVGSSQTRLTRTGDGPRMYTPRGYARKMAGGDLARGAAT